MEGSEGGGGFNPQAGGKDLLAAEVNGEGFGAPPEAIVADHETPIKLLRQVVHFQTSAIEIPGFFPLACLLPISP